MALSCEVQHVFSNEESGFKAVIPREFVLGVMGGLKVCASVWVGAVYYVMLVELCDLKLNMRLQTVGGRLEAEVLQDQV